MRKQQFFRILFITLLLLSVYSFYILAQDNLPEIFKKIEPSTVIIVTYDKSGKPVGQGSGFFIKNNGEIITNRHVLLGAFKAEVKTTDEKIFPITLVIGENKQADIICALVDIGNASVKPLSLSNFVPQVGEHVAVIGSPLGLERTISDGIVSAIRDLPSLEEIIQITAPISPGSSGSPVVNMKGQIIGVATFQMGRGQNLNFAIPVNYILSLKHNINLPLSEWYKNNQINVQLQKGALFIETEPQTSKVRILNISDHYFPGIKLKPGRYQIEVSSVDYETITIWIEIRPGETKSQKIALNKKKELITKKNFINEYGMEFAEIPDGALSFSVWVPLTMRQGNEKIKKFLLQTTEVTQGQWKNIMGDNPAYFNKCGDNCPVENVTWFEVKEFIEKLNSIDKTNKYRLPTEVEWTYACLSRTSEYPSGRIPIDATSNQFCFGDDLAKITEYAWYESNSEMKTHQVALKKPNPYGIYDMHGNVWEWCSNEYVHRERSYGYDRHIIKGGDWKSTLDCLSCLADKINFQGKLFVEAEPSNAEISIINKKIEFFQGVELDIGEYLIRVSAPDFQSEKRTVQIVGGMDKVLSIQLRPESLQKYLNIPKYESNNYWTAAGLNSKFRDMLWEKRSEILTLKGKDVTGSTEDAEKWALNLKSQFGMSAENESIRKYFNYEANRIIYSNEYLHWIKHHEFRENPSMSNKLVKQYDWRSNQIGFRLVKDP